MSGECDNLIVEWGGSLRCINSKGESINIADELNRLDSDESCWNCKCAGSEIPSRSSLGIDRSKDKFFYKGRFFQNENEFWEYVKDWQFMNTDQETFFSEWEHLGKEIWMNIGLRGQEISNGCLNEILQENFLLLLQKFISKDPTIYCRECKNESVACVCS